MAFNPFHHFRKHQKTFFAILTIICMFVFILQFGRGDAIERLMRLFGARRVRGELVATLNGTKVYQSDLERLSRERQIADGFVRGILAQASQSAFLEARASAGGKPDKQDPYALKAVSLMELNRMGSRLPPEERTRMAAEAIKDLSEGKKAKPANAQLYDRLIAAVGFEAWQTNPARPQGAFYFGGSTEPEQLLDFVLWRQQADRLGVVLNATDMIKALNRETGRADFLSPEGNLLADARNIGIRRDWRDLTEAELEQALIDEFRVLIAQEALLGEPAATHGPGFAGEGLDQSPAAFTPLEFLQFFRDNRTTLRVALLDIPVAGFESKVSGTPSREELELLYRKYKDQEYAPDRDEPGFKEPRRVRVEYVTASADSPYYRELARGRIVPPTPQALVSVLAAGSSVPWTAAAILAPMNKVFREYEKYVEAVPSWIKNTGDTGRASAVTLAVGAASPLAAAAALQSGIISREHAVRVSLAAGIAASTSAWDGLALAYLSSAKVRPLPEVQSYLIDAAVRTEAPSLVHEKLAQVAAEVEKLRTRPDEERRYIAKAVKDYDLVHRATGKPEDRYHLADDPALQKLKDAYAESGRLRAPEMTFVDALLAGEGAYRPEVFSESFGLMTDTRLLQFIRDPSLVFWRSEDRPARVRTFEEALPDVEAAWRHREAQRLARNEAKRVQAALPKGSSAGDVLRFLREQKQGPVEELDGVSMLVRTGPGTYQRYRPPVAVIAYPRSNFVDTLLTMKNRGDSVVVRDQPDAHDYVAVLLERSEPKIDSEFIEVFEKTPLRDSQLQREFLAQRQRQFRNRLMDQLRASSGATLDTAGHFKVPDSIRRRSESTEEG